MGTNRRINDGEGPRFGIRHLQCFLVFIGLSLVFALRVNLSVAIVAMTDKTTSTNTNSSTTIFQHQHFDWDEKIKAYLLGSFFWGYIFTQIPGGHLAEKHGAKYLLFFGILFSSIATILTPWCASIGGWKTVFASRLLQGVSQGAMFPACHVLLSKWSPPAERGSLATFTYSGPAFGTVVMLATSGVVASELGWPCIFYLSGVMGLIWCALWYSLGANSPDQCKLISVKEKLFIDESQGKTQEHDTTRLSVPWIKVLTSIPFWSLILVQSTNDWGYWTMLTQIPSYMRGVLEMDIKQNALLSSLPYLATCFMGIVFAVIANYIEKKKCMSDAVSRKLFTTIASIVPMIALICLGYITKEQITLAVALLTVGISFNYACVLGFLINHMDLAPNFAGSLMGTTNFFSSCMGILAPMTKGMIVTDQHDPIQWRMVFLISAGLYFLGNVVFLLFGSTEIQKWNFPKNNESVEERDVEMKLKSEIDEEN